MSDDISRPSLTDYRYRTDNKYFPNTEEGWKEFLWKVHFLGGKSMILLWHFDRLEKEARKNEEDSKRS
jgi:major membrane immunogen (membrane-anchored lipoprotein)